MDPLMDVEMEMIWMVNGVDDLVDGDGPVSTINICLSVAVAFPTVCSTGN